MIYHWAKRLNSIALKKILSTDPKAGAIEQVLVITNLRELLCNLTAGGQEHAVRHFPEIHSEMGSVNRTEHLHDIRLVYRGNTLPPMSLGIAEGVARYPLRGFPSDQLD